jgi:hypothetical protein
MSSMIYRYGGRRLSDGLMVQVCMQIIKRTDYLVSKAEVVTEFLRSDGHVAVDAITSKNRTRLPLGGLFEIDAKLRNIIF